MKKKTFCSVVVWLIVMACLCGCGNDFVQESSSMLMLEEWENEDSKDVLEEARKQDDCMNPEATDVAEADLKSASGEMEVSDISNQSRSVITTNKRTVSNSSEKKENLETSTSNSDAFSSNTKTEIKKQSSETTTSSNVTDNGSQTTDKNLNIDSASGENKSDINENESVHTHTWIPFTETKEIKVIDKEAYEEKVHIGDAIICKKCGMNFGQGEVAVEEAGMHNLETGHAYMSQPIYETVYHEEEYHFESESVVVGYECECGEYVSN